MKRELNPQATQSKAEAYCASAEHCISEVETKLYQWGANKELAEQIILRLLKNGFVDEQRYAIAFVRDKYRFNGWGKMKIASSLRQKGIKDSYINVALKEIDEQLYLHTLKGLLSQKRESIKASSPYEQNGKLIRFALSRGFDMHDILSCINLPVDEEALE